MGFPHPDYLLPYLSASQYVDWVRYANKYGIGIERDDIHWGMLLSMYYNANRDKDAPAKQATDFMPYYESEETAEEFADRILSMIRR